VLLGIDHLVIAVHDVEAATAALETGVGLAFTGGGRHEAMGTRNRLAFLGDTYLELIGVFDRELVVSSTSFAVGNASLAHLESGREGLVTFALATDALAAEVAMLQAAGSPIGTPVQGVRVRSDGGIVRWSTAFPELGPERAPFLIEHEYEGVEWGDPARAARATFRHPAGGRVRLAALELRVGDPDAVGAEYGTVLGIAFSEGWRARVGEQEVALRVGAALGSPPVVHLVGERDTPALNVELLGINWVRVPAP